MDKTIVFTSNTSFYLFNYRLYLMRQLKDKVGKVIILAPKDHKYSQLLEKEFEFYPVKNLDRKGINPVQDLKLLIEYFRLFKKIKPDLVINFTIKPNIYSSISAGLLGISSVSVVTGLGYAFIRETWLTKLVKMLYQFAFRFNNFIIFQNEDDMRIFMKTCKEKCLLIETSGIDTMFFTPSICESFRKDYFTFLYVGRLLRDKGIYELIEAFKKLKIEYPMIRLVIVGDVDVGNPNSLKREDLEEWIKESSITWLGFQEDVRTFYCLADCVVLPSYYREGVPRVLLEAMAMEKPIITSDSPGCRNVCIDGVNGFLVKPREIKSLYNAMKKMVEIDYKSLKKMGEKGRKLVEEKYEISKIADEYIRVIKEIIYKKFDVGD
jgi:glycosyltransferase involved in cell wall biosynthesis